MKFLTVETNPQMEVSMENKAKIDIHYDFIDGTELPYCIAKDCKEDFSTNCLEFFNTDNINATAIRADGKSISVRDLLNGSRGHITKEIRISHNLHKMLIANCFRWI